MTSKVIPKSPRRTALDSMWRRAYKVHREAHLMSGDDATRGDEAASRQMFLIARAAQELASLLQEARTGKPDSLPKAVVPHCEPETRDHLGVSAPKKRTCTGHAYYREECGYCRAENFGPHKGVA